jgi:hypothetical protein
MGIDMWLMRRNLLGGGCGSCDRARLHEDEVVCLDRRQRRAQQQDVGGGEVDEDVGADLGHDGGDLGEGRDAGDRELDQVVAEVVEVGDLVDAAIVGEDEAVVVGAARQEVVAAAARQRVVAALAEETVGGRIARDDIVERRA